ncbi:SpoIIE family protein phosphatase [Streptomyces viridochromogenes]|nr:SpoIIE family protein phosphatase [Streptomyces viridochromogenes]
MVQMDPAAIIDRQGIVTGWSEGARRLTGYTADEVVGRPVAGLLASAPPPWQAATALSGAGVMVRHRDGRALEAVVRAIPVMGRGGEAREFMVAAVMPPESGPTATEQAAQHLALLNEATHAIGTTLDMARTAEELAELTVPRFADRAGVDLFAWVLTADEPEAPPAADTDVLLLRAAERPSAGTSPRPDSGHTAQGRYRADSPLARAITQGRPVLGTAGEHGFDEWLTEAAEYSRSSSVLQHRAHSLLAVPLRARGTTLGVAVFVRTSRPDPFTDADMALCEDLASRTAICIDNGRRFARERSTSVAFQQSLLPQRLPGQAAVETAYRYLPAGSVAGAGGDWFDVIPLSGSRAGLVVGDVVGHGIHSSATMGRLCTAVRTLADVDLPPDELLTHIDDLVVHLATTAQFGDDLAEVGATCLYAVYDPVSRNLAVASAGHPPPAVVLPDGTVELVEVTPGPPLGIGGLPFETTQVELPEGSTIALYTDGLITGHHTDVDLATAELCRTLALPSDSLDAACDTILKCLLPERPRDDVALLLARTNALDEDQVATWDVEPDPSYVATARQQVIEQLERWSLDEAAFITELVVSELVTNAIRYGHPPIQLRLIRDRTLICEVSDGSSTAPHLRRAKMYDEGGRGLMMVAQLTHRWGSRQTTSGKTIWAEQSLHPI